jgi:hypothetical protein
MRCGNCKTQADRAARNDGVPPFQVELVHMVMPPSTL